MYRRVCQHQPDRTRAEYQHHVLRLKVCACADVRADGVRLYKCGLVPCYPVGYLVPLPFAGDEELLHPAGHVAAGDMQIPADVALPAAAGIAFAAICYRLMHNSVAGLQACHRAADFSHDAGKLVAGDAPCPYGLRMVSFKYFQVCAAYSYRLDLHLDGVLVFKLRLIDLGHE